MGLVLRRDRNSARAVRGVGARIECDLRPRIGFAPDHKKESVLVLGHSPFPQTRPPSRPLEGYVIQSRAHPPLSLLTACSLLVVESDI
jgi:hypothetical protein